MHTRPAPCPSVTKVNKLIYRMTVFVSVDWGMDGQVLGEGNIKIRGRNGTYLWREGQWYEKVFVDRHLTEVD